jgi:hypothetical protein
MFSLNAIFALREDLVLFLRNVHGDFFTLSEQVRSISETLSRFSPQPQPKPYMIYGQPSQFNANPSNVSFSAVHPGISFNAVPSSVGMNVGTPAAVSAPSGMCMFFYFYITCFQTMFLTHN